MTFKDLKELRKITEGKKLIIWGTGSAAEKLWYWLDFLGVSKNILFCVDNASHKKNERFLGKYLIENPKNLETIRDSDTAVLIASSYFKDINKQINKYKLDSINGGGIRYMMHMMFVIQK